MKKINIQTTKKEHFIDITSKINECIDIDSGVCTVFTPHTTAAITINENADPDVRSDLIMKLKQLCSDQRYKHMEGNSDAHMVSSLLGCSTNVIIENGKITLGTWQSIFFVEFDGPRNREVWIKTIKK